MFLTIAWGKILTVKCMMTQVFKLIYYSKSKCGNI